MRQFYAPGGTDGQGATGATNARPLVTSIRLEEGPGHDHVHVWNRGGKSGVLTVELGDGERFVRRLLPNAVEAENITV